MKDSGSAETQGDRLIVLQGCTSCFFCRDIVTDENGEEVGTCKRFPPVLSVKSKEDKDDAEWSDDGSWDGRYEHDIVPWVQPRVCSDSWCGEYRSRSGV